MMTSDRPGHLRRLPPKTDPTIRFFHILLVMHVLFWTLLSTWTQPNLPDETLEILTAGQSPAWGYYDHPPLAIWITSVISIVFAPAAWPAYLIAQLCIATCIWAAWKIGREVLHPWTSICGAIVLEGCFFFTIGSTALTSAHLAGAFWALAILALYRAFQLENRWDWVVVGALLGLGILSHYSTVLLIWGMCAFSLMNHKARRCWDTSWPFLAALTCFVIVVPHFWWAWANKFNTLWTALEDWQSVLAHLEFSGKFVALQLLAILPVMFLLLPIVDRLRFDAEADYEEEKLDFARQYLLVVTLLPAILMLFLAAVVGVDLGSTGVTMWTFAGVIILMWCDLTETKQSWRHVIIRSGGVASGFAALLIAMNIMFPSVFQFEQPSSIHFPGRDLAQQVRRVWENEGFKKPIAIIGGDSQLAQNASWYHGTFHRPLAFTELNPAHATAVSEGDFKRDGGVILWTKANSKKYTPETLLAQFGPELVERTHFAESPIVVNWQNSAGTKPLEVHYAVVRPAPDEPTMAAESHISHIETLATR